MRVLPVYKILSELAKSRKRQVLEKTFENYEKGIGLLRYCSEKIDLVEKKVQKLNADGTTESFE